MVGTGVTVKVAPLLSTPPNVTTTFPVVAPLGTGAVMLVALQLVGTAAAPLNVTRSEERRVGKFVPAIVTDVPVGKETGFRLVMVGTGVTVKVAPLLATPPTVK